MKCPKCGIEASELDKFCGGCGEPFPSQGGIRNEPKAISAEVPKSSFPYKAAGIISAIVSLLFFPPVFGILSIFCGYKVYKQENEGWGIGIMVMGGVFMIIGMIFGMLAWRY